LDQFKAAAEEHPYASALSLLCVCRLAGAPRDGEYFERLPPDVLPEHRRLIEEFWFKG